MKSGCIFLCRCDILKLGWAPKKIQPPGTVGEETTSANTLKKVVSDEIEFHFCSLNIFFNEIFHDPLYTICKML